MRSYPLLVVHRAMLHLNSLRARNISGKNPICGALESFYLLKYVVISRLRIRTHRVCTRKSLKPTLDYPRSCRKRLKISSLRYWCLIQTCGLGSSRLSSISGSIFTNLRRRYPKVSRLVSMSPNSTPSFLNTCKPTLVSQIATSSNASKPIDTMR